MEEFNVLDIGVGVDNSEHKRFVSYIGGFVEFAETSTSIIAHTWICPGEGKKFLSLLEQFAKENNKTLEIPTVVNPKLRTILENNGYKIKYVQFAPEHGIYDEVEVWYKCIP